ncbi:cobalt ECF transporter T component CbiQ [Candidatus Gracilibacteria bacterium]|nr:cobalt ECF transporter T component CbiQ [Candidatus Gracilibacteria bacterium]
MLSFKEQYQRGSSYVHRLDPRIKLGCMLLFVLSVSLLPTAAWLSYGLLFVSTLFIAYHAGLGWGYALRRSFVALPFVLAAIFLPFTLPGQPLFSLGPFTASLEGTLRLASIVLKSWISVQIAILLAATTPFPDVIWALRALRVPATLVGIISFMYRYIAVLGDEASRLIRARSARAAHSDRRSGGSLLWRGRVAGGMVGNLGLRAFERSERIYAAMVARGFTGEIRTLAPPHIGASDRDALIGMITFLAAVLLLALFVGCIMFDIYGARRCHRQAL